MTKEEQSCIENEETNTKRKGEADGLEALLSHLGDFGRYQKFLVLGMCPFGMMFSYVYFIQMFITLTPQSHWCRVPELSHLEPGLRRNLIAPRIGEEWDKCSMYVANWSQVLETLKPPDPSTPTGPCTNGWDFDFIDIPYHTVVTERGWVCEYAGYAPTAQAVFFAGSFVGVIFFGWLADAHGRVPALVGSTLLALIGGIATIFTTGFWDFTICRFLTGLSFDSIFMCTYILLIEYIGPRYRTIVANTSMAVIFGAGCLTLPWLALQICDWRKLVWITTGPLIIIVVAPFTVPESARWLLTKGHIERLVIVLRKFERINKKTIPQDELEEFIVISNRTETTDESIKSLMKSVPLRKMMVFLVVLYMIQALVFDGLVRMSEGLGANFFLTFTLMSATEVPSVIVLILILDRWGRRHVTCGPIIVSGVVVLIGMFVPKGAPLVSMVVFARSLINISYGAYLQWSTELLPTSVRASGSSLIHVSGFVAALFSPFVVYSGRVWAELPLLILAVLSLIAGGFSLLLPETMGRPLPQTFEDGERIVREYSLCGKTEDDGDLELQYRKRTSLVS